MPRYWRPIAPDNPGPKERGEEVRRIAARHGGNVEFVGCREGTREWYVLVDITSVPDPEAMARELRARGRATIYLSSDEVAAGG